MLARQARSDLAAANLLLSRVHPRIYQMIHMAVGHSQDAEDLIQACLLEIMEHLHKFRGTGSLESWAGQVTYRVTMRQLKRMRRSERTVVPVPHEIGLSGHDPEHDAIQTRIQKHLIACLAELPHKRRMTLFLRLVHEYSVAEVAELTGVSINTVKDHLRIGFQELRVAFSRDAVLREMLQEEIRWTTTKQKQTP